MSIFFFFDVRQKECNPKPPIVRVYMCRPRATRWSRIHLYEPKGSNMRDTNQIKYKSLCIPHSHEDVNVIIFIRFYIAQQLRIHAKVFFFFFFYYFGNTFIHFIIIVAVRRRLSLLIWIPNTITLGLSYLGSYGDRIICIYILYAVFILYVCIIRVGSII